MWVQLTSVQRITKKGEQRVYHPGDWVDVGRQTALLWVSQGQAVIPGSKNGDVLEGGSGIVLRGEAEIAKVRLEAFRGKLGMDTGEPRLAYQKTVIWDTRLPLRVEFIPVGLSLLDTWELAVPLENYDVLACHIGDKDEQEKTKTVVRDLRVPLYDTRLIFAKRTSDTKRLFDLWRAEVADGADERLSFLRCLYTVKPFILALPTTWTDPNAPR